ncbi:MAG: hypothetical protein QME66_07195 [Candidatus Eisenbacteria bacterium]|nr:hypothetical protein [Candidatus Eisenbacteria bacterium]
MKENHAQLREKASPLTRLRFLTILLMALGFIAGPVSASASLRTENAAIDSVLSYALLAAKLTPSDLHFRSDYEPADTFRLELISKLLEHPYGTWQVADSMALELQQERSVQGSFISEPIAKAAKALGIKAGFTQDKAMKTIAQLSSEVTGFPDTTELPAKIINAAKILTGVRILTGPLIYSAFAGMGEEDVKAMISEASLLLRREKNVESLSFEELTAQEESTEVEAARLWPLAGRVKLGPLVDASYALALASESALQMLSSLSPVELARKPKKPIIHPRIEGEILLHIEIPDLDFELVVGGRGPNKYTGHFSRVIDLGGDDTYMFDSSPSAGHLPGLFQGSLVMDLGGGDTYLSPGGGSIASGIGGVGILIDMDGDDLYSGRSMELGSGLFGVGVLHDRKGNDRYLGESACEGSGAFGIGILQDLGGNDVYLGSLYCQGFGFVKGLGLLDERGGNDSYQVQPEQTDILRYSDHSLTLSQGFAYGWRPDASGGIGILSDLEGNDFYSSDIFGQGGSYWYSLGALIDRKGNDTYSAYQYAQGAGIHVSLGVLLDEEGSDTYLSKGVSQGCGHDLGLGTLIDLQGDDRYIAYDLSQGAGNANGVGILLDRKGNDSYEVRSESNTQGYGNFRRHFGSVGLFVDESGQDLYSGSGRKNNFLWRSGRYGIGIDF